MWHLWCVCLTQHNVHSVSVTWLLSLPHLTCQYCVCLIWHINTVPVLHDVIAVLILPVIMTMLCLACLICQCCVCLTWGDINAVCVSPDITTLCLAYLTWHQHWICLTWCDVNAVYVYVLWCQCCVCLTWCDVNVGCLPDVMSMLCRSSSRRLIFSSSSCLSMSYKRSFSLWKHETIFLHFRHLDSHFFIATQETLFIKGKTMNFCVCTNYKIQPWFPLLPTIFVQVFLFFKLKWVIYD